MKIAIVGLGKFGKTLVEHLCKENHDIVAIDIKSESVQNISNDFDVKGYIGNGASYDSLKEAGVANYDILVACTASDEINMLACAVAKKIGIKQTIIRYRNREYTTLLKVMSDELGVNLAINTDVETAKEVFRIIRYPSALKVETFCNNKVDLIEIKVESDSLLLGKSLSQIREEYKVNMLVVAIKRDNRVFIPTGSHFIAEGDFIYVTAESKEMHRAFKKLELGKSKTSSTMIIGASQTAYQLALLLDSNGIGVTIIDRHIEKCKALSEAIPSVNVICGEATNKKLLLEEGLENVDSFVTLTGLDETNIVVSSYAKSLNVPKVITKTSATSYDDLLSYIQLDSVVSPKDIFASTVIRYVRGMENANKRSSEFKTLYRLVNNKVEASEFVVSKETKYTSIPIKDLKIKEGYLLASIIRDDEVIIPSGTSTIEVNDHVIIVTTKSMLKDVSDILE